MRGLKYQRGQRPKISALSDTSTYCFRSRCEFSIRIVTILSKVIIACEVIVRRNYDLSSTDLSNDILKSLLNILGNPL